MIEGKIPYLNAGFSHLLLVRPMKTHPVLTLLCCTIVAAAPAFAAPPQTFKSAAAEAARHFGRPEGHEYAMTFVRAVLKATYDASQACKQSPSDAHSGKIWMNKESSNPGSINTGN